MQIGYYYLGFVTGWIVTNYNLPPPPKKKDSHKALEWYRRGGFSTQVKTEDEQVQESSEEVIPDTIIQDTTY